MKHKQGNTPKCFECLFYIEREDKEQSDFCSCINRFKYDCNHVLRNPCPDKWPTTWNNCCQYWQDAETFETLFSVMTSK